MADRIPTADVAHPVSERHAPRPRRRAALSAGLACAGLLGLSTLAAGAHPTSPTAPRAGIAAHGHAPERAAGPVTPQVAPPAAAPDAPAPAAQDDAILDFGGAEIDEGAALRRDFGDPTATALRVEAADMDGDGHLDLVAGYAGQDVVYLNDGAGNYDDPADERPFNGASTDAPGAFALGDLDGDGDVDAIGWLPGSSTAANRLYLNDGSGDLSDEHAFPGGASGVADIAIADLDRDGALDVVLARDLPGSTQNEIYLNQDTGASPPSFGAAQPFGTGLDQSRALATGDVDEDGDVDIAVANGTDGDTEVGAVYLNDGSGGFYSGPGAANVQWEWGMPASSPGPGGAFSGQRLWATDLDGEYEEEKDEWITSPSVDLSGAGAQSVELRWRSWLTFGSREGDDEFYLEVSADGGASWQELWGLPDAVAVGSWVLETASVPSSYFVSDFQWRFRMVSNADTDVEAGWYVDDVELDVGGSTAYSTDFEADDGGFTSSVAGFPADEVRVLGSFGADTRDIALGDMDGDGSLDVVLGNHARSALIVGSNPPRFELVDGGAWIFANDGAGTFDAPANPLLAGDGEDSTVSLALGDVDGDGRLDLALGQDQQQNRVLYNRDDGGPSFDEQDTVGPDLSPTRSLTLADADDDGALDAVVGNAGQQSRVYLSPGALGWLAEDRQILGGAIDFVEDVALGDVDADGDLDLVHAKSPSFSFALNDDRSYLFLNQGDGSFDPTPYEPFSVAAGEGEVRAASMADLDGDGRLEVLLAFEGEQDRYLAPTFSGGTLTGFQSACPAQCFGAAASDSLSLVTGDVDRDGDLDVVVGRSGADGVFLNDGAGGFGSAADSSFGPAADTGALALGDLNGDGFLDVVAGRLDGSSAAYLNDGTGRFDDPEAERDVPGSALVRDLALGDLNGDGALDLVLGNDLQQNRVHFGDGLGGFEGALAPMAYGTGDDPTLGLDLGDLNGDGHLDIAVANGGPVDRAQDGLDTSNESNAVYLNDGADPPGFTRRRLFGSEFGLTTRVALGDLDADGALDLLAAHKPQLLEPVTSGSGDPIRLYETRVYLSALRLPARLPDRLPAVAIGRPGSTADAPFFSPAELLTDTQIDVPIVLYQADGVPVGRVALEYSTSGGGAWLPALATTTGGQPLEGLAASPGGSAHTIVWDTFASGLFGQSDQVVLRVRAFPQRAPGAAGDEAYPDESAGPRQWPYAAATTFPFRVRGTQIQVVRETPGGPGAPDALVYRLPSGETDGAPPFSNAGGQELRTDAAGFLRGTGSFGLGDQLYALEPITRTNHYTVYHSSAIPVETGLEGELVSTPGLVELVVKAEQPLMIFNLDIALEWDARSDEAFLTELEGNIARASEVIFDYTNGQAAIGPTRIFHAKNHWLAADVIVNAANNLRPAASLGGVVDDLVDDVGKGGELIEDAYVPGQVQMGPSWGRFGDPDSDLGEDWPRALAHELGHYYFYLMDNYLGVRDNALVPNDCVGSVMTDVYTEEYSELLARPDWTGACLDSLAEATVGRSDWETVRRFYPWLNTNNATLAGPQLVTLSLLDVEQMLPETPARTLATPYYSLRDGSERVFVQPGGGRAYLYKNQDTSDLSDDYVVPVGVPVGDQVLARGAEPSDRLCVFVTQDEPWKIGCETVGASEGTFQVADVPGWMPDIQISPVATDTLAITVTQAADTNLMVQVLPQTGLTETFPIVSTVAELLPVAGEPDVYSREVQLAYPTLTAYVRVWEPGASAVREEVTQFVLGDGWGPNTRAWGPNTRAWGPNTRAWGPNTRAWGAPVSSGDGQVTVYNLRDIFGDTGTTALQSISALERVPEWLSPVGNVQRFEGELEVERTIAFLYRQDDVPGGNVYEAGLRIYYSADRGLTWSPIESTIDPLENLATGTMPSSDGGQGLYMLASTIATPAMSAGWNQLGYPVEGTRPITEALASIQEDYRLVYDNGPTADGPWQLYAQDVIAEQPVLAPLVNTLGELDFGGVYWVYALRATVPFLDLPELGSDGVSPEETREAILAEEGSTHRVAQLDDVEQLPPATVYGWVTPSTGFAPATGDTVVARIDGASCGTTTVQAYQGQLAFVIQVDAASDEMPGCGATGRKVVFSVGDRLMAESATWDNTRTSYLPLSALATGADLEITQTVLPAVPAAGQPYAYLVTVRNKGPLPATNVQVQSGGLPGVDRVFAAGEQRYCTEAGGLVYCALGSLPPFSSQQLVISAIGSQPGETTHVVQVSAFEPDPVEDNDIATLTHGITVQGGGAPTAVSLASFRAQRRADGRHLVTWQTLSEVGVQGFLLHRAPAREGPYERLTPILIPARGSGASGADYAFVAPPAGTDVYYRLETVASYGLPETFGPVPVKRGLVRIHLPVAMRP